MTTIYYFSATGNSLTTARILAEEIGDARLMPVAALNDEVKVIDDSDCVGFVFPVYYGNMPWPVRAAVSKMVLREDAYVFSFTTWRGHEGKAPFRLDQILKTRGARLSMAKGIPMPGNSFINEEHVDREYLEKQRENIREAVKAIKARDTQDYTEGGIIGKTPIDYANNFRGIMADENCVGCGLCAKVCPMGNISIKDGRAVIGDDCATCLACFHWCPNEAIYMSKQEGIARRKKYRHPDVTIEDIIGQKSK